MPLLGINWCGRIDAEQVDTLILLGPASVADTAVWVMQGASRRLPEADQGVRLEAAVWRDRGGVRHDYLTR